MIDKTFAKKILFLVLTAGFLPIGIVVIVAIVQMQIRVQYQQEYALNQGYEQVYMSVDDKMTRLMNISTLIAVNESIPAYLSESGEGNSLAEELARFEEIDSYSFGMEMSFENSNLIFYIDDSYPVVNEYSGRYRSLKLAQESEWYPLLDANNGRPTWVKDKDNITLTRKLWSTENYDICVGILALVLKEEDFKNILIPSVEGENIYIASNEGVVLTSNNNDNILLPASAFTVGDDKFREIVLLGEEYLVQTRYISKSDVYLVAMIPSKLIKKESIVVSVQTAVIYVLVAIMIFILLNPRISRILEEQYKLGQEKTGAELKALQSQINPHFLYNTLDMINWMAQKKETDNIQSVVQEMSRFYRLTLSKGKDIITIGEEIKMCNAYMEIQKRRYKGKICYEVEVDDNIFQYNIPKITLQPILENAIIHGINEKEDGRGVVMLNGWEEDGRIILSITDDGIGMDENHSPQKGGSHYGMENIEKRLRLFFNEEIKIQIESSLGIGTCVIINIPQVKKEDSENIKA